jgi:hypothetical protein
MVPFAFGQRDATVHVEAIHLEGRVERMQQGRI